jgi:hypothetical protein
MVATTTKKKGNKPKISSNKGGTQTRSFYDKEMYNNEDS